MRTQALTEKGNGLPIELRDGRLDFGHGIDGVTPEPRRLQDMSQVLLGPVTEAPDPLYLMYRDVKLAEHQSLFEGHAIRHDITVISPGRIGREFIKTAGHYHIVSSSGDTYPEVYQVLEGSALYLLQLPDPTHDEVVMYMVRADRGDIVVVPPNFGHVTVNVGNDHLVMANLVASEFPSRYEPYRALRGAATYVIGEEDPWFLLNPHYRAWSKVTLRSAAEWNDLGLGGQGTIYWQFVADPDRFQFLTSPEIVKVHWWL